MMLFLGTFLEGLASFLSPCTLPLMPAFAAYFAGDGSRGGFARALAFVAGFTGVFVTLGLFAAAIGGFFAAHRTAVSVVSGLVVAVFGLAFLDLIRLPGFRGLDGSRGLSQTSDSNARPSTLRVLPVLGFGALYAVNLTPCVGAFLAAALATAAETEHALKGAALLLAYSAGLGIPFVVAGVALSRLNGLFRRIKAMYKIMVPVCGVTLIGFGAFLTVKPFVGWAADVPPRAGETKASKAKEMKIMEITSKEMFEREVLKSEKPAIVDFWAPWCGPCRAMGPVLEEIAAERPDLKVCKVNVDELGDLAAQYMVTSIPCIFSFRNGSLAARSVGLVGKAQLLSSLGL